MNAERKLLVAQLREHALIIGEVVLSSGATAQYYVDAKRATLRPAGFAAMAQLVAQYADRWGATAVGGLTMGADPVACAALAGGADVKAFFVRKESKSHGLQRRIEGPPLTADDRCLIVEDVVTTGSATLLAIEAVQEAADLRRCRNLRSPCGRWRGDYGRRGRAVRSPSHNRRHLPRTTRPRVTLTASRWCCGPWPAGTLSKITSPRSSDG